MRDRELLTFRTAGLWRTLGLAVCLSAPLVAASPNGSPIPAHQRVQDSVEAIKARLNLPYEVTAQIVDEHPLMVAVAPAPGRRDSFQLSLEGAFIDELSSEELDAVVAHELGHVWIFTHHPYLQTEQLANEIAMRVVSRQTLEAVYAKVQARGGHLVGRPRLAASTAN